MAVIHRASGGHPRATGATVLGRAAVPAARAKMPPTLASSEQLELDAFLARTRRA